MHGCRSRLSETWAPHDPFAAPTCQKVLSVPVFSHDRSTNCCCDKGYPCGHRFSKYSLETDLLPSIPVKRHFRQTDLESVSNWMANRFGTHCCQSSTGKTTFSVQQLLPAPGPQRPPHSIRQAAKGVLSRELKHYWRKRRNSSTKAKLKGAPRVQDCCLALGVCTAVLGRPTHQRHRHPPQAVWLAGSLLHALPVFVDPC